VERFDPRFPVLVGGLLNDEQRLGYIQVFSLIVRERLMVGTIEETSLA
jgi:hypothetical protein